MILKPKKGYLMARKGKTLKYHKDVKAGKNKKGRKIQKESKRINANVILDESYCDSAMNT